MALSILVGGHGDLTCLCRTLQPIVLNPHGPAHSASSLGTHGKVVKELERADNARHPTSPEIERSHAYPRSPSLLVSIL